MRTRYLPVAIGLAVIAAVIAMALAASGGDDGTAPVAQSPFADAHQPPPEMRTVTVFRGAEPAPSETPIELHVQYRHGAMPRDGVTATVLSDEDCAPDAEGVSHCRNQLRLRGGRKLTVTHPHRMTEIPCLSPGERVRVAPVV